MPGKILGKKNPHIMWGKTGMVSMARKTGCYWLLPVLLLLDNFSDEPLLHSRDIAQLFHSLIVFLV